MRNTTNFDLWPPHTCAHHTPPNIYIIHKNKHKSTTVANLWLGKGLPMAAGTFL